MPQTLEDMIDAFHLTFTKRKLGFTVTLASNVLQVGDIKPSCEAYGQLKVGDELVAVNDELVEPDIEALMRAIGSSRPVKLTFVAGEPLKEPALADALVEHFTNRIYGRKSDLDQDATLLRLKQAGDDEALEDVTRAHELLLAATQAANRAISEPHAAARAAAEAADADSEACRWLETRLGIKAVPLDDVPDSDDPPISKRVVSHRVYWAVKTVRHEAVRARMAVDDRSPATLRMIVLSKRRAVEAATTEAASNAADAVASTDACKKEAERAYDWSRRARDRADVIDTDDAHAAADMAEKDATDALSLNYAADERCQAAKQAASDAAALAQEDLRSARDAEDAALRAENAAAVAAAASGDCAKAAVDAKDRRKSAERYATTVMDAIVQGHDEKYEDSDETDDFEDLFPPEDEENAERDAKKLAAAASAALHRTRGASSSAAAQVAARDASQAARDLEAMLALFPESEMIAACRTSARDDAAVAWHVAAERRRDEPGSQIMASCASLCFDGEPADLTLAEAGPGALVRFRPYVDFPTHGWQGLTDRDKVGVVIRVRDDDALVAFADLDNPVRAACTELEVVRDDDGEELVETIRQVHHDTIADNHEDHYDEVDDQLSRVFTAFATPP